MDAKKPKQHHKYQYHGARLSETFDNVVVRPHRKFFSIWVFFRNRSRITGLQGKGEGISLKPHYYFHPLHRHLDINRAITAESSPLHIGSSRTRTRNLLVSERSERLIIEHNNNINNKNNNPRI